MSVSFASSPNDNQRLVLDAWPVMEWLKGRKQAADRLDLLIERAKLFELQLFMSRINLGELYYSTAKTWGVARADDIWFGLHELPIRFVSVTDDSVLQAARLKAAHKISYADAFAATLAMELQCPLLTGDAEFRALERSGTVQLDWIGA
jgi:predicted nucleic acid-binding protein